LTIFVSIKTLKTLKHSITLLLLTTSFFCYCQDVLILKSANRIFNSSNIKLSNEEVRNLFASNTEALRLYNSGKTKQTIGNIFLYGGISTVIIKHITMINKYSVVNTSNVQSNNIMYFVGAGLILTAIPIKIGLSKKIKKAVLLMNEDLKTPKTSFNIESTSFISNSNGFGISITF
jgi:hypothetical protein